MREADSAGLRVMLEPQQGGTYEQIRRVARAAEAAGWDGLFRSDHLLTIGGGPRRDALEAWTTLAALARDTERLRIGTLVSPMTFRHPAILARMVATVDQLSGGRLELGIGAGWYEEEHAAFGIPLPPMRQRMDRFEEAAGVIADLLTGEPAEHHGGWLTMEHAVALPRPVQPHVPVIVGGHGGRRSARLAARRADEYNTTAYAPGEVREVFAAVRAACEAAGREPSTLRTSWMGVCIVAPDEATLQRRCLAYARINGDLESDAAASAAHLRTRGIVGGHGEAAERMREYREAGCERLYLRLLDLDDTGMLEEISGIVEPAARRQPPATTGAR